MQLLVIAKEPRPGHSKTRLTPPCTPAGAAHIAEAALADTLAVVAATPATRRVIALDGRPGRWLPAGCDVVPQVAGGLGDRLDAAFTACFAASAEPVVLIGMDTPQVTSAHLRDAGAELAAGAGAVFGPALDGGWWLLGLARPAPGIFDGVPMSEANTGAVQLDRLRDHGLAVAAAPVLRDVDHAEDAVAIAAAVPGSRFAAAVRAAMADVQAPSARS